MINCVLVADHILVLRNAGPKGGPGMPEWGMIPMPKALLKQGHRDMIRLSDARMSGTSYGACILHVAPEAFEIYTAFSQPLLQLSKQLATSQSIDHTALVQLTSDTHEFTETLTAQLQQGRDRLIELNSFNADQAQHLIAQIEHASQAQNLLEYMERVFDQLGIITEFHSDNSYVIKPGEHMQAELVGLKEDGNTITYSRAKALRREDMEYMSWEHPMVSECLEIIANSEFGNTAVAVISTNALEKGSLLIETWYSINLIADQRLQLQRYLPSTPTRCLLDNKGNDYSQAISYEILNPLCQSLPKKTALAILQKTKALLIPNLIGNIPDHETTEILIANNVDINAIDNFGMTPLDWTKGRNGEKGAIAKTLLEHGAKTAEELKS